jgi:streptomycin 6-kinase
VLREVATRWGLTVGAPFPDLSFNYVAPATRADGTRCILKVSRFIPDTRNEIAALRLWDGDGCCRLLAADEDLGALLLEALEPGTMLTEVAAVDDDEATRIAARIARQLWRPVPSGEKGLRSLDSWCDAFYRNRDRIQAGAPGFPLDLFRQADSLRAGLLASTNEPVVLHGDLHHYNILRAQRAKWLAIDPKGAAGDRCFDVCQFLRNPWPGPDDPHVNARRLDIFCEELGLDRERAKAWCLVHAVLDALWAFEEGDGAHRDPLAKKLAWAERTLSF